MKTVDPLCLLLAICAQASRTKDGRPTKSDLMRLTGFSATVVSTGYAYERSAETIRQIGLAFAELYGIEPSRLLRLLDGKRDDALSALLEMELRKMRCTGNGPHLPSSAGLEGGWYDQLVDAELIIPAIRRCKACALRSKPRVGDSWSVNLKRHADKLPAALSQAIAALEAKGRAPNYKGLAEEAQMPLSEVRRTIAKAGLEKERKGRKNFARYLIWPVLWYLFGVDIASAAVADEPLQATSGFIHYRRNSQMAGGHPPVGLGGSAAALAGWRRGARGPPGLGGRMSRRSVHAAGWPVGRTVAPRSNRCSATRLSRCSTFLDCRRFPPAGGGSTAVLRRHRPLPIDTVPWTAASRRGPWRSIVASCARSRSSAAPAAVPPCRRWRPRS